ncbi:N-acetylmuramoyl-L-alanine amidase [Streptomyces albiflavescens]|uniref:N-acetylmuramoyl-L-alanine amidase n=1 Tax=Streptomyces albiflavescens TaxID=1623582 RepID=UPI00166F3485|nr:peptidoglycan recognition family protein [Streptomyces albiflavescens]
MRGPVTARAPAARCLHRTARVTASAALLLPLLSTGPLGSSQTAFVTRLQRAFADAAAEYRVPQSVLLGVSYMQSRWDAHVGAPSVSGGYGPMHLTDTRAALAGAPHDGTAHDAARRPTAAAGAPTTKGGLPDQLTTLERAARLLGVPASRLRTDAAENVRGGAALLAKTQRQLGRPQDADPAGWWGAVARFSGSDDSLTAATFANNVFEVIREGARRTTDTGQQVSLGASPGVRPDAEQVKALRLEANARNNAKNGVECPETLACDWIPAPHEEFAEGRFGNHDVANRPLDQKIQYIIIHDTEALGESMIKTVQDPAEASWHYTIRSRDGHTIQHVKTKDVGWHSGNQFVNAKSIGIEHEGFLAQPDTWYTEQMYRSSARLVRYLAKKYDIPLDRQHILGHDNVPGPVASTIPDMHQDPGPYWDWRHYFALLGAPLRATAGANSDLVTVLPDFGTNRTPYTGCTADGKPCAPHGSAAVRLYTEPSEDAPLVQDSGRHPDGEDSTTGVYDIGSRISTGQQYAVAERRGDWTAIWYLGQKAWFRNPSSRPTAVGAAGLMVTPKPGLSDVPVYGRANPEESAYPADVPFQPDSPLPYELLAGQRYATQGSTTGAYFDPSNFDSTSPDRFVKGGNLYYQIQFGHRLAFVRATDVDVVHAGQ